MDLIDNQLQILKKIEKENEIPTLYFRAFALDEDDEEFYETSGIKYVLSFDSKNHIVVAEPKVDREFFTVTNHIAYIAMSHYIYCSLYSGEYVVQTEMGSMTYHDINRILISYGAVQSDTLEG